MSKIKSAKTNPGSIFPNTLPSSHAARRAFRGLGTFPCFPSAPSRFPSPAKISQIGKIPSILVAYLENIRAFCRISRFLSDFASLRPALRSAFRLRETRELPVWSNKHPLVSLAGNSGNCWGHLRFFFFLASVPSLFIDRFVQAKPRPEDQPRQQRSKLFKYPATLNK